MDGGRVADVAQYLVAVGLLQPAGGCIEEGELMAGKVVELG